MDRVKKERDKKYLYIEIMRIVAVFFVIFNHTGNKGFFLFSQYPIGGIPFWLYLIVSVFCKFSVPLFFMISGALLLEKEESLTVLWRKRIFRMICTLLLISIVYYCEMLRADSEMINIKQFIQILYSGKHKYHLGFLYTYIVFLITLPFIRCMVREMKTHHFYYMIISALFMCGVLPVGEYLIWKGHYTIVWEVKSLWLVHTVVLYPCLGYFCQYIINLEKNRNILFYIWAVNILGIALSCFMTYYKGQYTGVLSETESQTFHSSFVILNAMAVYLSFKYIFQYWHCLPQSEKIILSIGKCTFGIYLIHPMIMGNKFIKTLFLNLIEKGVNHMVAVCVYCFVIMLISYIIVFIIRKMPILNALI